MGTLQGTAGQLGTRKSSEEIAKMNDLYEDLGSIMGELEGNEAILNTMILNGKNGKINIYPELFMSIHQCTKRCLNC